MVILFSTVAWISLAWWSFNLCFCKDHISINYHGLHIFSCFNWFPPYDKGICGQFSLFPLSVKLLFLFRKGSMFVVFWELNELPTDSGLDLGVEWENSFVAFLCPVAFRITGVLSKLESDVSFLQIRLRLFSESIDVCDRLELVSLKCLFSISPRLDELVSVDACKEECKESLSKDGLDSVASALVGRR